MIKRQVVYDTYWYFAFERQNIFFNKLNVVLPLTSDTIFQTYKFCNAYRASDRVSQYLIQHVIYGSQYSAKDMLFRIILFRLLNKIETWEYLEAKLGEISWGKFNRDTYSQLLNQKIVAGETIYGNAFILCANKAFGFDRKHDNHLALLSHIFETDIADKILKAKSLESLFNELKELPLIGNFMAYQLAIDLNYSELFNFSENDFTMPGPGALRGIKKVFENIDGYTPQQIIMYMVENQEKEFKRLGLKFKNLFGRPLQAIDCQNLFCEVDKYSRVKFPELTSNRSQIKSTYIQSTQPIEYFYPPKWKLLI